MQPEQFSKLDNKARLTNILLTMLLGIVSGYFLSQGVSGILWLLCIIVSIYSLVMLSVVAFALIVAAIGYIVTAVIASAQTSNEDERLQALNDIYNKINPKK